MEALTVTGGPASALVDQIFGADAVSGARGDLVATLGDLERAVREERGRFLMALLRDGAERARWEAPEAGLVRLLKHDVRLVRAAALLIEVWIQRYGWEGLSAGARLYRRLLDEPPARLEPPDASGRHALFFGATREIGRPPGPVAMPLAVWNVSLVEAQGQPVGLFDLQLLLKKTRAFPDLSEVEHARGAMSDAARAAWLAAGDRAVVELGLLQAAIRSDFEREGVAAPTELGASFTRLIGKIQRSLADAEDWLKGGGAPAAGAGASGGAAAAVPAPGATRAATPVPRAGLVDRADALRHLDAAVRYFERADPHSPVLHRLRTARRWMTQTLTAILATLISSDDQRAAVTKGLGLDPESDILPTVNVGPPPPNPAEVANSSAEPAAAADGDREEVAGADATATAGAATPRGEALVAQTREQALRSIEAVVDYLARVEPHSIAKFPLAFAVKVVNMPIQSVIEQAISNETAREALLKELGVPFLQPKESK